jgi:hypothetical protein
MWQMTFRGRRAGALVENPRSRGWQIIIPKGVVVYRRWRAALRVVYILLRNSYPHRQPESNIHEICVNVVLLQEQQHIDYLAV